MAHTCTHLETIQSVEPSGDGCVECLRDGGRWLHLRICMACGHIGCCDSSPGKHATGHFHELPDHPIVRSYEPGEDWWWCFADQVAFDVEGAGRAPSHP